VATGVDAERSSTETTQECQSDCDVEDSSSTGVNDDDPIYSDDIYSGAGGLVPSKTAMVNTKHVMHQTLHTCPNVVYMCSIMEIGR
jgi:hypothetical protein